MNKKILLLIMLLVVIATSIIRISQVNTNAFAFKDTLHPLKEPFQVKEFTIMVKKAYEMTEEEIKLQKEMDPTFYMEDSDTILAVELNVENNGSSDDRLMMSEFQLNKGIYVTYASRELIQKDSETDYVLKFVVPKNILHSNEKIYLAVPPGVWNEDKRDLVEFEI
ncbi:hypothetical protein MHB50_06460 [Siminovitchia sp. FSL H7-0308]|uniref:DUF4352 domain-containing protein n=1 Tax=Siminovitchia thermophila TaxID=1245522 RepID=A0ABS2R996_9BACI|nr:hypothetical protein [Siminovitchia thermophila]MBM7716217.1 hypothetical protein [Siminovitchia thermophila]ONK24100.1 hypothetical protein BLX87_06365 [Bacillus sp. VT-16-64]